VPTVVQSPVGGNGQQFVDSDGDPISGGKLYSYVAGTTTPLATYTSVSGGTANANPIILDTDGRADSGGVWVIYGYAYKFVLYTSTDVLVGSWDNIYGGVYSSFIQVSALPTASASTVGVGYIVTASAPYTGWVGTVIGDDSYAFTQVF